RDDQGVTGSGRQQERGGNGGETTAQRRRRARPPQLGEPPTQPIFRVADRIEGPHQSSTPASTCAADPRIGSTHTSARKCRHTCCSAWRQLFESFPGSA